MSTQYGIPVSIQKCPDYSPEKVRDALRSCMQPLGGMAAFVGPGSRVLLKPNLLAPKAPETCVCTHPAVVRAVSLEVQEAGGKVYIGDSPAFGTLAFVLKKSGIAQVTQELGIEAVPFATPAPVPVPGGGVHKSFLLAREAAGFDLIINLPKFKTHGMMTVTLAVKNMFGAVVGAAKPGWHLQAADTNRFADMLLDVWRALPPDLNVLDGIVAMEGNGPGSGDPKELGILAVSESALALDQVASDIALVPAHRNPVIYQARQRGIEGAEPDQVQVIGARPGEVRSAFMLPKSASRVDFKLPAWMNRSMRKSLNSFPALDPVPCTTCGACADICPADAITLHSKDVGGGIVDKEKCISCFCCVEVCPEGAIEPVPGALLRVLRKIGAA
jgi:uncharacterized protein (DUF362 family)/ferredoxin